MVLAARRPVGTTAVLPGRAPLVRGSQGRQADDELAALVRPFAAGLDGAAVHLDQAADQRQADAQAALRAGDRAVGLGEQVEDPRQQVRFDADAVVANAQHRLLGLRAGPSPRYGPACRCTWRHC